MTDKEDQRQPYAVYEASISKLYNIYFSEEFIEPYHYNDLFNLLRNISPTDFVNMYVNSEGGDLHTGAQLIKSMRESPATITTYLDGTAHSLAPIIILAGDDISVSDHSLMMFHDYSVGHFGKGNEIVRQTQAYNKFYRELLETYAHPFLSIEEIDDIVSGKDLYLDSEQIKERLDIIQLLNEKTEAKEEPDEPT